MEASPTDRSNKDLKLVLPAKPQSLARVRRELEAHAARIDLPPATLSDLQTVVSEACANAVRYAYGDDAEGPLEVELFPAKGKLTVCIRDRGQGICPRPDPDIPTLKLGLPLIGALSNRMRLTSERGTGTELEAEIPIAGERS
jgi:anti-sigma regulatory factor (Ser/Thr protein kinase)